MSDRDNNHLDLASLRELNRYWYDDIDLYCPHCRGDSYECPLCNGAGYWNCLTCNGTGEISGDTCPACDGVSTLDCDQCNGDGECHDNCPVCENQNIFEILWDTAFRVPYLKTGLTFKEAKRVAWDQGWLLFEHGGEMWIAAGSCGYDFTWVKARVALAICGDLPDYYRDQLQKGGAVFVSEEDRIAIAEAAIVSIDHEIKRLNWDRVDLQSQIDKAKNAELIAVQSSRNIKINSDVPDQNKES